MSIERRKCDQCYQTSDERIAVFRVMTPAEKIELSGRESDKARKLMMEYYRNRNPKISQMELALQVISRQEWLDEYLAQRPLLLPGMS